MAFQPFELGNKRKENHWGKKREDLLQRTDWDKVNAQIKAGLERAAEAQGAEYQGQDSASGPIPISRLLGRRFDAHVRPAVIILLTALLFCVGLMAFEAAKHQKKVSVAVAGALKFDECFPAQTMEIGRNAVVVTVVCRTKP